MSFISVVKTPNFMTIIADSRGSEIYSTGHYYRTISETEEKIIVLPNKNFYAIVGIAEDARNFIDKSEFCAEVLNEETLSKRELIEHFISKHININSSMLGYSIIFGGLSSNNELKLYILDSNCISIQELECSDSSTSYMLFPSKYWDSDYPDRVFRKLYGMCDGSLQSVIKMQEMLNDEISRHDQSVNTIKKVYFLQKG